MRKLTIYLRPFYNADCYNESPKQTNYGVQVHSTGASNPWLHRYVQPDDGRIGLNKYNNDHNRPGGNVCAGAYIGKQTNGTVAVYEVLPENQRPWLSGKGTNGNANHFMFGFEICEDKLDDECYFNEAVKTVSVNYCAHLCKQYNVKPWDIIKSFDCADIYAISDHKELHDAKCASNHGDITGWLRKFGYNMDDYRCWVQEAMIEGVEVTYVDCDNGGDEPVLFEAEVLSTGYLNLRAGMSKDSASIAKMKHGEIVSVLQDYGEWWYVRYRGITGYAMSEFMKKIEQEPIPCEPCEPCEEEPAPCEPCECEDNNFTNIQFVMELRNNLVEMLKKVDDYLDSIGGEK